MNPEDHQPIGFFPNLLSVLLFAAIMVGMFFGFTKFYPELAIRYVRQDMNQRESRESGVWSRESGDRSLESGGGRMEGSSSDGTKVEEQIAPFVRGIIVGVQTAQLVSMRESSPLNISQVRGWLNGLRTAILTSRSWYNLDRQLFRSRGLIIGVQAAIDTSKPTLERATLEYQVKLIQRIQVALETNLDDLLANTSDRRVALTDFLSQLNRLAEEAAVEVSNMQRVVDEYQALMDQQLAEAAQFSDAFTEETSSFLTENIDSNISQFLSARRAADEARVRVSSTRQVLARLSPLAARLPVVIQAIQANFEALAAGIRVSPTSEVNLPLFQ